MQLKSVYKGSRAAIFLSIAFAALLGCSTQESSSRTEASGGPSSADATANSTTVADSEAPETYPIDSNELPASFAQLSADEQEEVKQALDEGATLEVAPVEEFSFTSHPWCLTLGGAKHCFQWVNSRLCRNFYNKFGDRWVRVGGGC